MDNLFERATRVKFRFDSCKGLLSVEDLWSLPLKSTRANQPDLDGIAKGINRQIKATQEVSFVEPPSESDSDLAMALEICKHIIAVKQRENAEAKIAADKREQKQKIMAIMSRKQDEKLESLDLVELEKLLASLD